MKLQRSAWTNKNQEVMHAATWMWLHSLEFTVWPNVVFMVSEEIRKRSGSSPDTGLCIACGEPLEFASENMEHNLFHCSMTRNAKARVREHATKQELVGHG